MNSSAQELLASALKALGQQLEKKQPHLAAETVSSSLKKIGDGYGVKVESVFEKLGSFCVAHIFRIPRHVLLPEDEAWDGQTQSRARAKLNAVEQELQRRRERVQDHIYKKHMLTTKLARVERACELQEQVLAAASAQERRLDLGQVDDRLAATQLNYRLLQTRLAELGHLRTGMGLEDQVAECGHVSRSKTERHGEVEAMVLEAGL